MGQTPLGSRPRRRGVGADATAGATIGRSAASIGHSSRSSVSAGTAANGTPAIAGDAADDAAEAAAAAAAAATAAVAAAAAADAAAGTTPARRRRRHRRAAAGDGQAVAVVAATPPLSPPAAPTGEAGARHTCIVVVVARRFAWGRPPAVGRASRRGCRAQVLHAAAVGCGECRVPCACGFISTAVEVGRQRRFGVGAHPALRATLAISTADGKDAHGSVTADGC